MDQRKHLLMLSQSPHQFASQGPTDLEFKGTIIKLIMGKNGFWKLGDPWLGLSDCHFGMPAYFQMN